MSRFVTSTCQRCGESIDPLRLIDLPVEPLYDLDVAVVLIPMPYETLRKFLARHPDKFKKRYRLQGREHRKIRLLSAGEIKLAREMAHRGEGPRITELSMARALLQGGQKKGVSL